MSKIMGNTTRDQLKTMVKERDAEIKELRSELISEAASRMGAHSERMKAVRERESCTKDLINKTQQYKQLRNSLFKVRDAVVTITAIRFPNEQLTIPQDNFYDNSTQISTHVRGKDSEELLSLRHLFKLTND